MPQRFLRKGTTRFYWVPTIAAATKIPTAAEVTAGTRLDEQLHGVNGFSYETQFIDAPNFLSSITPKELGEDQLADSTLSFYELKSGTDTIRAVFVKGTTGFIVIFYAGTAGATPAAADKADVWPVTVGSRTRAYSAGNELAAYNVRFAVTSAPAEEIAISA